MKIALIRHGATAGNAEKRYVGSTDEPLSERGIAALHGRRYPDVEQVYASPMKRCLETAALLYPPAVPTVVEGFRECDFGAFEYRNYDELKNDAAYQAWIDSGGTLPFPNGEDRAGFSQRSRAAFLQIAETARSPRIAVVAHGGTLMAIMERFAFPQRGY